ncbi:ZIP family metal transporter [Desulfolutivibrio sulfoxidireducens]|uniref:ZIP family metal transporter n=1 Tax=Desulfolutivibrio sulfoxidireducens TaxID=2773299 RepID=UPI00159DAD07|nr:ZIP family metal transporter [Desulfolutivibrio sulfoxidireducens]QLA17479.1 ZIP family metal transporter [Desulfolutivibrio sulfoxidireducens]QLA21064.1 ZIP family metal transporter [Desulfolutivibrio sulfoxidireducens]
MSGTFETLHPTVQALLAGCFTWGVTALGAALVFFTRTVNKRLLDLMLGFAAGVMIAASFWSLLAPAIEMSDGSFVPAVVGFLAGGLFLRLIDAILPHLHLNMPLKKAEGIHTTWRRSVLLVLAITLHNIPEGLAVGVAFGGAAAGLPSASLAGAMALALGIGLQNFPEGLAVSAPLRREGFSRLKSFWYGQMSGAVEPLFAVLGATVVVVARPILPYALAFAAGAMIFVVVEEVIPESQAGGNADWATLACMAGFAVMMALDVGLG